MGGSSQTQSKQETATNTTDPRLMGLLQDNYNAAQGRASTLTPYSGPLTAGFNPTQTQAQGIFSGIATDPNYMKNANSATGAVQGVLDSPLNPTVTPQAVTSKGYNASTYDPSTYGASTYDAAQVGGMDLSKYLNPYTKNVIDSTISDQERARQIAGVHDSQAATAAGAFGGSRSGVAASLTNDAYDRNTAGLLAGLNQDNFKTALGTASGDVAATNAARGFNAGALNTADQFNAGARNTAGAFNANSNNTAGQFNSGQDFAGQTFNSNQNMDAQKTSFANALAAHGLTLDAAGKLVTMNNNALSTASAQGGILSAVGDAQQAQQQKEYDDAINAWQQGQQLTVQQQQLLNSALGLIPNQQTITSSGTGTTTSKGDLFGGILGAIAGGAKIGSQMYGGG